MSETARRPRHRWFAAFYDRCCEPAGRSHMDPLRRFAAGQAWGRVLEVGAGVGSNLPYYDWDRVESVDLTEPDPYMAKRIAPRLSELPPGARERVRLSEAPAESLPFPDGTFDCAVVTLVLCSVDNLEASLAELRRVLKPGGEMRLVEHVRANAGWGAAQQLAQPVYGYFSGGCKLTRDTESALLRAGFDLHVVERTSLGGPLHPTFTAVARKPMQSVPAGPRPMPARRLQQRRRLLRRGIYLLDRRFLRRPHRYAFQAILAMLTLGFVLAIGDALTNVAIISGIGATTYILFMAPDSKMARPRRVAGGHFVGCIVGLAAYAVIQESGGPLSNEVIRDVTAAVAVGAGMLIMAATDTEHPPAAGTILGLSFADNALIVAVLLLTGVVALSMAHRLFRRWLIDLS